MRTPLAWYNLTYDRKKLLVALAGVGFAVILMFVQYGFRNALLDSTTALIERMDGDLFLVSRMNYTLSIRDPFPRRRMQQAMSVGGVKSAHPVYIEYMANWAIPERIPAKGSNVRRSIRTIGIDPDSNVLLVGARGKDGERLTASAPFLRDRIFFDRRSKEHYGFEDRQKYEVYLGGRRMDVAGTFELGTDFGSEGNLIVSTETFAELFAPRFGGPSPLESVDVGVLRLAPGANVRDVQRRIRELGDMSDVDVLTKSEFVSKEQSFWTGNTPIGYVFTFGMAIGFVVGVVICFQILSTDVTDHLPEYATLKAIGYSNNYLVGVILQQAVLLGVIGFFPGLIVSWLLYIMLEAQTGLPMRVTVGRSGFVLVLTVGMCIVSGLIALRKVQTADPAEVF